MDPIQHSGFSFGCNINKQILTLANERTININQLRVQVFIYQYSNPPLIPFTRDLAQVL